MSWNIARSKHPYYNCELVNKKITEVVSVSDPNNKKLQRLITQILSSRRTAQRCILEISADIAVTMQSDLKSSLAFSFALDESIDTQNNP